MAHFTPADLTALFTVLVNAGYTSDGPPSTWSGALSLLHPRVRGGLHHGAGNPNAVAMINLGKLNNMGRQFDGLIPFEVVLGALAFTADPGVADLSRTMLARLQGAAGLGTPPGAPITYTPSVPEAYTGTSDDLLTFDFLANGARTGAAVVKLVVPRFDDDGHPVLKGGEPQVYYGTGWLVSGDLVFTNVHVIAAREPTEPDPSPRAFEKQVAATAVHLDYDRAGAAPRATTVTAAIAYGTRGTPRDYALLRVVALPAGWPPPLRLRPARPRREDPINIIQHPLGNPKQIAIRKNLVKDATAAELHYFSDTLPGSSGAPLCNDAWEIVGIHRASGLATNVTVNGHAAAHFNIGIPIKHVLDDLQASNATAFAEISPAIL